MEELWPERIMIMTHFPKGGRTETPNGHFCFCKAGLQCQNSRVSNMERRRLLLLENTLTERDLTYSLQLSCEVGTVVIPILQKRKQRLQKAVT